MYIAASKSEGYFQGMSAATGDPVFTQDRSKAQVFPRMYDYALFCTGVGLQNLPSDMMWELSHSSTLQ